MIPIRAGILSAMAAPLIAAVWSGPQGPAQSTRCDTPLPDSVVVVPTGGRPVDVLTDPTGCLVFVTIAKDSGPSGILLLRRTMARFDSVRFIPIEGSPFGMRLSQDGTLVYVAAGDNVSIVDVVLATRLDQAPVVGIIRDGSFAGAVMVNVTSDGQFMFISQERAAAVSVVDLRSMRGSSPVLADCGSRDPGIIRACGPVRASRLEGARIIGRIPTGRAPIAVELSADGRRLYVTSQEAPASLGWPVECRPQANRAAPPDHVAGAVLVVDVERATRDPAAAILATVKAGCNPVRLALAPNGQFAWVTARTDDQLLLFDTRRMEDAPAEGPQARVPVGTAPVGVAVIEHGARVVVTSSNRFGPASDGQDLLVIQAAWANRPEVAVRGRIRAGAFPRQLHLAPDGRTLYLTNFSSGTLQVMDLDRVMLEPVVKDSVPTPTERPHDSMRLEVHEQWTHGGRTPSLPSSPLQARYGIDSSVAAPTGGGRIVHLSLAMPLTRDVRGSVTTTASGHPSAFHAPDARLRLPSMDGMVRAFNLPAAVLWNSIPGPVPSAARAGLSWTEPVAFEATSLVDTLTLSGTRSRTIVGDSSANGRRYWLLRDSATVRYRERFEIEDVNAGDRDTIVREATGTITGQLVVLHTDGSLVSRADTVQLEGTAYRHAGRQVLRTPARYHAVRSWIPFSSAARMDSIDRLRQWGGTASGVARSAPEASPVSRPAAPDTMSLLASLGRTARGSLRLDVRDMRQLIDAMSRPEWLWSMGMRQPASWEDIAYRLTDHPPAILADTALWPCTPEACELLGSQWRMARNPTLRRWGLIALAMVHPAEWADTLLRHPSDESEAYGRAANLVRASQPDAIPVTGSDWRTWLAWLARTGTTPPPRARALGAQALPLASSTQAGVTRRPPPWIPRVLPDHLQQLEFHEARTGRDVTAELLDEFRRERSDSGRLVLGRLLSGRNQLPYTLDELAALITGPDSVMSALAIVDVNQLLNRSQRKAPRVPADSATTALVVDRLIGYLVDGTTPFRSIRPWVASTSSGISFGGRRDKVPITGVAASLAERWKGRVLFQGPDSTTTRRWPSGGYTISPVERFGPFIRVAYRSPGSSATWLLLEVNGDLLTVAMGEVYS